MRWHRTRLQHQSHSIQAELKLISFVLIIAVLWCAPLSALTRQSLSLGLKQDEYLAPASRSSYEPRRSLVSGQYQFFHQSGLVSAAGDVGGEWSLDNSESYVFVPDLYVNLAPQESWWGVTFGRQRRSWSVFDEAWGLGIWQPMARWDYIHPQAMGLTGLFLDAKFGAFQFTVLASPLYLPDQGPSFELVDGQFQSNNRWFRAPQSQSQFFGETSTIHYQLIEPEVEDVVLQGTYALGVRVQDEPDQGPWLAASWAHKPLNQLHIGIKGRKSSRVDSLGEDHVQIYPKVVRHQVATLEGGYQAYGWQSWVSVTGDFPEESGLPREWEESKLQTTYFTGAGLRHQLPLGSWRQSYLGWSFMKSWEHDTPANEGLIGKHIESSLARFPFREMAGLEWSGKIWNTVRRSLSFTSRFWYSVPERGSLLSMRWNLTTGESLHWMLGFDLIGAEGGDEQNGLMSRYRSNDRVVGGFSYVF